MRYLKTIMLMALMLAALTACGSTGDGESAPPVPGTGGSTSTAQGSEPAAETAAPAAAETAPETGGDNAMAAGEIPPADTGESGAAAISGGGTAPGGTADGPEPASGPESRRMEAEPGYEGDAPLGTPSLDVAASDTMTKHGVGESPMMPGSPGTIPDERDWRPRHQPELKAGEVDDNARWQEYLRFVEEYEGPDVQETDLRNRQIVTVLDRNGNPVPNADVVISASRDGHGPLWTNRTYADGRTMFSAEATNPGMVLRDGPKPPDEFSLTIRRDGFTKDVTINAQDDGATEIRLDGTMDYGKQVPLDVLFLLDSTGSMADEIRQIKNTLSSIARQVSSLQSNPDLRFGMVSYRDRGDEYVTRLYDFDGDVERFQHTIRGVLANGGDDYPESLNQALHEAVNDASWHSDSIRLVFLIADAPPHLDYDQDEDYAVDMVRARERGIKIFSVASSGLDEQGEYVFRQIAQQTMGRFLFILYRTGGPQGGLDTPHDVEQYSVDQLDDLIVRLIEDELEALGSVTGTKEQKPGMSLK